MAEVTGRQTKIESRERAKEQKFIDEARKPFRWIFYGFLILATLVLLVGIRIKYGQESSPAGSPTGAVSGPNAGVLPIIAPTPVLPLNTWIALLAPSKGSFDPKCFPGETGRDFEFRFKNDKDKTRGFLIVGGVEYGGLIHSPGRVCLTSTDNDPIEGWIMFCKTNPSPSQERGRCS